MIRYLVMILVGMTVFTVCTVTTPYWGVVAVFACLAIICFRWEALTQKASRS